MCRPEDPDWTSAVVPPVNEGWARNRNPVLVGAMVLAAVTAQTPSSSARGEPLSSQVTLDSPFVVTQVPAGTDIEKRRLGSHGLVPAPCGDGAHLVVVLPDGSVRAVSRGFQSACDPEVSFDAARILFAGKKAGHDHWNIYEMASDGSNVRQITRDLGDCRSPCYQSTLYTIISPKPWYQLTFVGTDGTMNEFGPTQATSLYSCKLDGSAVRRLTFNLSSDMDPFLMSGGRVLFASWRRSRLDHGLLGRVALFGINIDGTDCALFASYEGGRIKRMPCVTTRGLAVFVEANRPRWDGAGYLSRVQLRRPLHSYRQITSDSGGLFHSPSPLPDGRILVSRRPDDGSGTHGVYRLDPASGKAELVFDDSRYHDIQARVIAARTEPDGRSSVVTEKDPNGKLYCLDVYNSDLPQRSWLPRGTVKRIRVLEGVPLRTNEKGAFLPETAAPHIRKPGSTVNGIPPLVQRRILGEIPIENDGSFNIEIPANTPIELQILDADGMALRSCGWIWAKNHEPRGCVGCHEDGELTPENWFRDATQRPSIELCLPADRRRTVDFRRDVMPIITQKCAQCHRKDGASPCLHGGLELVRHASGEAHFNRAYESLIATNSMGGGVRSYTTYVRPGEARTSPLIWHVFGRNTCRPWDQVPQGRLRNRGSGCEATRLTEDEKQTLVEWIDLGALWDGIPGLDNPPARPNR